jgi:hypothetical protein
MKKCINGHGWFFRKECKKCVDDEMVRKFKNILRPERVKCDESPSVDHTISISTEPLFEKDEKNNVFSFSGADGHTINHNLKYKTK